MKKECYNCKFIDIGWYHDNRCKSPKALIDLKVPFDEVYEVGYPSCKRVHTDKNIDCKYFKIGFLSRIGLIKRKICKYFFDKKLRKYKD